MAASWDTSKYLSLFVSEATEHLEALSSELVRLEQGVTPQAIDSLFRHAHSVKGMAGSMGFEATSTLGHRLEDLLDRVRSAPNRFDRTIADLVLQAIDALSAHVRAAAAQQPFPDSSALTKQLEQLTFAIRPGTTPAQMPILPAPPVLASSPKLEPELPPRFEVTVRVQSHSAQPGVRGFLAYKRLSSLGNIFGCVPPLDEVKAGKVSGGTFTVDLETTETEATITKVISQVADVELLSLTRRSAPPPTLVPNDDRSADPETARIVGVEAARSVRVRAELLDHLLDVTGELLLATASVRELERAVPDPVRSRVKSAADRLQGLVRGLHDTVMEARMTPASALTDRLPRAARDIARKRGREIELVVAGGEVLVDRAILDELNDPVLHLLRNAIDHGIEAPEERKAMGKPARGQVKLSIRRSGDRIVFEVEDDGRGMNVEKLKSVAVSRGLITEDDAKLMPEPEALLLSTLPGVSTATQVTDISGRGVGMDAVRRAVESVGGTLEIHSRPNAGTKFLLSLPFTVSLVNVLLVGVGDEVYGLPIARVLGVVELSRAALTHSQRQPVMQFGAAVVPVRELCSLLEVPGRPHDVEAQSPFVVVEAMEGKVALAVDAVVGQEEVVLKALARPLDAVRGLSGVTVLGDGRPVFVLDVSELALPARGAGEP